THLDDASRTITGGATASVFALSHTTLFRSTAVADDSTDTSAGVTFSLSGPDAAAFTIDANTGAVTLTGNPDFEAKAAYTFTVVGAEGQTSEPPSRETLGGTLVHETRPTITS